MGDGVIPKRSRAAGSAADSGGAPWNDGVAIIGMSARFPGSRNIEEYWQHLLSGDLLISELSAEELLAAGVEAEAISSENYVRRGSAIAGAEDFDTELFGFSRREAEVTDPQQRVLLECAWEALEQAGYLGTEMVAGIFAGVGMNSYLMQLLQNQQVLADVGGYQVMLGNEKDFLATRIAYKLNLKGPAVTVQTACSTSLAAVHLACESILRGECALALAGGVSIAFPQAQGYPFVPGMILSPDGFCRPFDAAARGTVPGRGAGLVVLKRVGAAVADGDTIYAVVRGSAWNNDGAGKIGYTVPSEEGQAAVIRQALAAAGVSASKIGYIEAHGTATELGDPIEFSALRAVFEAGPLSTEEEPLDRVPPGSVLLGSVKSNMGHADVAAGIAGLIKASLAVYSGQIPATLHFNQPNPYLNFGGSAFSINRQKASWQVAGHRWAGVSSFGIGGTNVHAVLSQAPFVPETPDLNEPQIIPLSARTPEALEAGCGRLRDHLLANPSVNLADVAWTLQVGRRHLAKRRAIVAGRSHELIEQLQASPRRPKQDTLNLAREVVFLFPGQGQQFHGMAEQLYRGDRSFRRTIDEGLEVLRSALGNIFAETVVDGIKESSEVSEGTASRLRATRLAQPTLFLTEYALARRWMGLGVEPAALLGHSLGELVAATVAGVFSFEDGLRLAAQRGEMMSRTRPGMMLAVSMDPEGLAKYLHSNVWLAAENGPAMSVASGLVEAVEELEHRLASERIGFVRLDAENAFHTPLMAEAADAFVQEVALVTRRAPTIPWLSNVTGTWIGTAEAQSPHYWGTQILSPVRFMRNLSELADHPRLLIEMGPGEALTGLARRQISGSVRCASLGSRNRRHDDHVTFLQAAASVWESGVNLDWKGLSPAAGRRIPLPTYPFERQRCFIEPLRKRGARAESVSSPVALVGPSVLTDKRADLASWFYAPSWQSTPPASITIDRRNGGAGCWLVLTDRLGLGEALAEKLRGKGDIVLTAAASDRFHAELDHFELSPTKPEEYRAMWQAISDRTLRPTGLVNLWSMRGMGVSAYDTLVLTLQAAGRLRHRFQQIEIVTDHLQSPTGGPVWEIERAEVLGLARALAAEYRDTDVRTVDVDLSPESIEKTAAQLAEEFGSLGDGLSVAYRIGQRWSRQWLPAPLPPSGKEPFRDGGVYVITGGLGGVGFLLARHLLRRHGARVALIGRTALPLDGEQEEWLALDGFEDAVSRRISRLKELESLPGEVLLLKADVADAPQMGRAVERVREVFGAIHGVVHAAGLATGGMIASQDLAQAAATRMPKVKGTMVLAELLRHEQLDFFLLTSSLSSLVPTLNQAAYAAANAFQDNFAGYCRTSLGLPAIAINLDTWGEVGMAAEMVLPEGSSGLKELALRTAMTAEEGVEVIRRVLAQWTSSQIAVSTIPLEQLRNRLMPAALQAFAETYPSGGDDLEAMLTIWRELLGTDDIHAEDNFFELGGHSLMGTMLIPRVRDRFGVVLTLRMLFESPTPRGLAAVVATMREVAELAVALDGEREEFEF